MFGNLPTDIIIEILIKLPVKSLPRLVLVCKLWYSRMSSPGFITAFSSRRFGQRDTSQFLLFFHKFGLMNEKSVLSHDGNKFKQNSSTELALPIKSKLGIFCFVGCCDGLICFQDICDCIICIWNPCIPKAVSFTFPRKSEYQYTFGFGFISEKNIYKVVRILYLINHTDVPPEVEVYEQGEGKWREIGCAPPRYSTVQIMPSQVFLHGVVHWLAYDWTIKKDSYNSIVAFEMVDEVFRDINLAPIPASHLPGLLSVSLLKDFLAVLCGSETGKCSLWVMRDYGVFRSWTNLYNVSLPGVVLCLVFQNQCV